MINFARLITLLGIMISFGPAGCGSDQTSPQQVGWAVGKVSGKLGMPVVFKTLDGTSWTQITSSKFKGDEGRNVCAVDNQCAWITITTPSGTPGQVLRTLDGGATWEDVTPPENNDNIPNVKAVSRDIAWVGALGYLGSTTDGGKTWKRITPAGHLSDAVYTYSNVQALDAKNVWAVGQVTFADGSTSSLIDRTQDGVNWLMMTSIPGERNMLLGLAVAAPETVMVTSNGSTNFSKSTDGGATWNSPVNLGSGLDLNDTASLGRYVWSVRDRGGFFLSSDDGSYFTSQPLPNINGRAYDGMWVTALTALDMDHLWIGGTAHSEQELGGLLWTNDAGRTWHEPQPNLYGYDIWRISFVGGVK